MHIKCLFYCDTFGVNGKLDGISIIIINVGRGKLGKCKFKY
jgi:hypothetical protein